MDDVVIVSDRVGRVLIQIKSSLEALSAPPQRVTFETRHRNELQDPFDRCPLVFGRPGRGRTATTCRENPA